MAGPNNVISNLAGIMGSLFRLGIGGPFLKFVAVPAIEHRNALDSGYCITRGLTPAQPNDLVTKAYVDGGGWFGATQTASFAVRTLVADGSAAFRVDPNAGAPGTPVNITLPVTPPDGTTVTVKIVGNNTGAAATSPVNFVSAETIEQQSGPAAGTLPITPGGAATVPNLGQQFTLTYDLALTKWFLS